MARPLQYDGAARIRPRAAWCKQIAFVVLVGAYSLAFWALQGCQMWRALQRLL